MLMQYIFLEVILNIGGMYLMICSAVKMHKLFLRKQSAKTKEEYHEISEEDFFVFDVRPNIMYNNGLIIFALAIIAKDYSSSNDFTWLLLIVWLHILFVVGLFLFNRIEFLDRREEEFYATCTNCGFSLKVAGPYEFGQKRAEDIFRLGALRTAIRAHKNAPQKCKQKIVIS